MWVSGRVDGKFSYLQMHFLFKEWFPWPSLKTVLQMCIQIYFVPFEDHLQQTWDGNPRIRQYSWLPKTPFRQRIIPKLLKSTNFVPNSTPGCSLRKVSASWGSVKILKFIWDCGTLLFVSGQTCLLYCASKYLHSACMCIYIYTCVIMCVCVNIWCMGMHVCVAHWKEEQPLFFITIVAINLEVATFISPIMAETSGLPKQLLLANLRCTTDRTLGFIAILCMKNGACFPNLGLR